MAIKEQIQADLKNAMKSGRPEEVQVLRMVLSALHNKEIEKGGTDEAGVQAVLAGEAKKRKEAALAFENGGRADLAAKEREELVLLQKYLPEQMAEEEVKKEVLRILAEGNISDFGQAMKAVMAALRGRADSEIVQAAVKSALQEKK